ncbi:3-oxoacyl-[acyl-carrier-protein] reductase [Butyrivibrio sp. MC2013]|uniref:3-oxoacyl-[acyl-carrier-protein] reductase n=1 Tax=Butyrivibrio sp. MC2013 TaxID=1280686 RepID=UPI0003FFBF9F|nr:3-oxoacyl-[acyl-carrier-protein] reductase [Butyrivibrio sp. MC2013]
MDKASAIVTGAGRGIGRAIAVALAKKGYNLVLGYAGNDAAAKETMEECQKAGGDIEVMLVKGDIGLEKTADDLLNAALSINGRVDVLVNNAGITRDKLLAAMSADDFDAVYNTNLKGAFMMMQKVTRPMMKQKSGRIINMSSIVGICGNAGQANYAASKAGIIGLTKSAAKELASRNITVNAVAPGMIETDMTAVLPEEARNRILSSIPMKRMGTPEDVAGLVTFLAGPDSSYITGQVIGIDGGMQF